jgi:hypothetical protein
MLKKSLVLMMILLVVTASLIGICSMYQYVEGRTYGVLEGRVYNKIYYIYASSDGKACLALVSISLIYGTPNLGFKPGDMMTLLAPDESICAYLGQSVLANKDFQFWVAPTPLTLKAIPPTLRENFPPNQSLYRVISIGPKPGP